MKKELILALAIFSTSSAFAVVDENSQQNAICYVKVNAPDLVFGQLPFSCDGKPESFVAKVKEELDFLSTTELIENLNYCKVKIFEPKNMTNVARGVWGLKDSPIMSTNAAIASSISDACKIINESSENISSSENNKLIQKSIPKFIHPLDFDGSDAQKNEVISYIQERVKADYCKTIDMCQETTLRMMENKNLEAFKSLTQATDRKILDRAIHDYCDTIDMCSYQMVEMMYNQNLKKSKEKLTW